jgi:uncharacterized protein YukE
MAEGAPNNTRMLRGGQIKTFLYFSLKISDGAKVVSSRYCAQRPLTKGIIMAQAIMDPEKVRRFADELQRFNTDLENRLTLLHARFAALGDTWGDQEHAKFADEFKTALKALKKFVELSKEHTPYLLRKAQRIEEYLNQR